MLGQRVSYEIVEDNPHIRPRLSLNLNLGGHRLSPQLTGCYFLQSGAVGVL